MLENLSRKEKKGKKHCTALIYMAFMSRTCIVDPSWTIKGTGIPLPRFRCPLKVQNQVLRRGLKLNVDNTQKMKSV